MKQDGLQIRPTCPCAIRLQTALVLDGVLEPHPSVDLRQRNPRWHSENRWEVFEVVTNHTEMRNLA